MPEVIIKYKKSKTLNILKKLSILLDFKVSPVAPHIDPRFFDILIPGNKDLNLEELKTLFTGKEIDAKQLRNNLWQRKV